MTIYRSTKAMPYVYICIHKITNEFYIGYREHNVKVNRVSSLDIFSYKTSSKAVRKQFTDFDVTIIAEFFHGVDAFEFEQNLIAQHWGNPLLLNRQYRLPNGKTKFLSNTGYWTGKKNPAVSASNSRRTPWNKGLTKDDPRILAASIKVDRKLSQERFSKTMKQWHQNHSVAGENNPMFGVKRKTINCEHCNRGISDANYYRWHGARCKLAP